MSNTQTAPTASQAPAVSSVSSVSKPNAYCRFAATVDRRITKVGRHALVGVAGGGAAAAAGHYGVAGLTLTPTVVGVGVGVGVGVSLLGDLVLIDADEYAACRLMLDSKEVDKRYNEMMKGSKKSQGKIDATLATL